MSNNMILKGHDMFASLTVDEIHKLSSFSAVKEFREREIIFMNSQPATHFYILMDGLVYLQLSGNSPEFNIPISKVEKGELFGISPLLKSSEYTLTAQCYKNTKALAVEAKPFNDVLQQNCVAGIDIITHVAQIYFTRYLDLIKRFQNVVGF